MEDALQEAGLRPHDIVVEITERVAIVRHDEFQTALRTFKDRGYRVAGTPPPAEELEEALRALGIKPGTQVEIGEEELEWQ